MTDSVKKIAPAIIVFTALMESMSAFASQSSEMKHAPTGVIHFTGAIVAPPCVVETDGHQVETQCWHDNGEKKTASIDAIKLAGKEIRLPNHKGIQTFNWINKDNQLGIYTVIYD
ncbi:hypothetical protein EC835_1194 [Providencia alcalifaciens]|uniref:Type 1 fimbrial protein n=1 Tax=Providencia alcalifaciens TaxID=126385 RepID=A0A4R3NEJ0_9GAMM|nr:MULTISPECIES: hypothetical protein [Providencia]MBC5792270.1 hypothetical protein [Providencia sp. JUb39]TCT28165.1 hypothetical protein EC835_1194 [Providencia alcalifaciens]